MDVTNQDAVKVLQETRKIDRNSYEVRGDRTPVDAVGVEEFAVLAASV